MGALEIIFLVLLDIVALVLNVPAEIRASNHLPEPNIRLEDVILDGITTPIDIWIPTLLMYLWIVDAVITIMICYGVCGNTKRGGGKPYELLRMNLVCIFILYIMRASVIWVTSYPDPSVACQGPRPHSQRFTYDSCGVTMFSGHTIAISLSAITVWRAFVVNLTPEEKKLQMWWWTHPLWLGFWTFVFAFLSIFTILWSYIHYTADVLVSLFLTGAVHYAYLSSRRLYLITEGKEASSRAYTDATGVARSDSDLVKLSPSSSSV